MIKAVIFDADGPLYHRSKEVLLQKYSMLKSYGFHGDLAEFDAAYDEQKFNGYVRAVTIPDMLRAIMASLGVILSDDSAKECALQFNTIQRQVEASDHAVDVLAQLQSMGYKICILTDSLYSSSDKWPWFEAMGMRQYIDSLISSYDIRLLKDTPGAYQACLRELHVTPQEAVFVGHQQYEMVGAKAAHITSIALLPIATLNIQSDYSIQSLADLPKLLGGINA